VESAQREGGASAPYLSVIIPIYNEEDNINPLMEQLFSVLQAIDCSFEVLAIDDGSRDRSFRYLQDAASRFPQLKVVRFRRNFGQTAAMMAGIDYARGDVIVSLDADLQNDPADIPLLLAKLDDGYDVVSGWRKTRQDARFRRVLTSRVASRLISWVSGVRLHDYGCTLKAYRGDIIKNVKLYGEMHRFIPIYASWRGASVAEVPVRHHPRTRGQSKYGLERVLKVVLDILVVIFLDRYFVKPIYVFGGAGLMSMAAACGAILVGIWQQAAGAQPWMQSPWLIIAVLFFVAGFLSVLMGLLAEMTVRTYFESQRQPPYVVRESLNLT
jgi:glycosyltransferase involved in cell wall biosynthesis